jgi:TatD DNase family protein
MPLIDTHAHLDFYTETSTDQDEVLRRAYAAGVETILAIGIGEGPETMHQALQIADAARGPGLPVIYASVGIHPQEAASATDEALERLEGLAVQERCVAIGEIGLDYYHLENPVIPVQKEAFVAQMLIARELRKPIVIHCRTSELATPQAKAKFGAADAWEDLLELIAEHWTPTGLGGIMHCFSGRLSRRDDRWKQDFIFRLPGI